MRIFLLFCALLAAALLTAFGVLNAQLEAQHTPPSTNLTINFTNKGEGSAYVHWLLQPGLATNPNTANFGTVPIGSQGTVLLTLTNDGPVVIQFLPFLITGTNAADFAFLSRCPEFLNPNVSCTVVLTFKPTAIGARTATLAIPFAGTVASPPASLQIMLTKLEPPQNLIGTVVERK